MLNLRCASAHLGAAEMRVDGRRRRRRKTVGRGPLLRGDGPHVVAQQILAPAAAAAAV
jgi:hypothetical protein